MEIMYRSALFFWLACTYLYPASAGQKMLAYVLTSECIEHIQAQESIYPGIWEIEVTLKLSQAGDMESVTGNNIGKLFAISDAKGQLLEAEPSRLRTPLSRRFRVSGFKSEGAARRAYEQLMKFGGGCGQAPNLY